MHVAGGDWRRGEGEMAISSEVIGRGKISMREKRSPIPPSLKLAYLPFICHPFKTPKSSDLFGSKHYREIRVRVKTRRSARHACVLLPPCDPHCARSRRMCRIREERKDKRENGGSAIFQTSPPSSRSLARSVLQKAFCVLLAVRNAKTEWPVS